MGKHQMTEVAVGLSSKGCNLQKVEEHQPTSKQHWGICLYFQTGWEWSTRAHGALLVWSELAGSKA